LSVDHVLLFKMLLVTDYILVILTFLFFQELYLRQESLLNI